MRAFQQLRAPATGAFRATAARNPAMLLVGVQPRAAFATVTNTARASRLWAAPTMRTRPGQQQVFVVCFTRGVSNSAAPAAAASSDAASATAAPSAGSSNSTGASGQQQQGSNSSNAGGDKQGSSNANNSDAGGEQARSGGFFGSEKWAKTVGTVGAIANWAIPMAAITHMMSNKDPATTIDPVMTSALAVYSVLFMRWAIAVTPANYPLLVCHISNEVVQLIQLGRWGNAHYGSGAKLTLPAPKQ